MMPTGCSRIEVPHSCRWRLRFKLLEKSNDLLSNQRLNRQWIHAHQLFSELEEIISLE